MPSTRRTRTRAQARAASAASASRTSGASVAMADHAGSGRTPGSHHDPLERGGPSRPVGVPPSSTPAFASASASTSTSTLSSTSTSTLTSSSSSVADPSHPAPHQALPPIRTSPPPTRTQLPFTAATTGPTAPTATTTTAPPPAAATTTAPSTATTTIAPPSTTAVTTAPTAPSRIPTRPVRISRRLRQVPPTPAPSRLPDEGRRDAAPGPAKRRTSAGRGPRHGSEVTDPAARDTPTHAPGSVGSVPATGPDVPVTMDATPGPLTTADLDDVSMTPPASPTPGSRTPKSTDMPGEMVAPTPCPRPLQADPIAAPLTAPTAAQLVPAPTHAPKTPAQMVPKTPSRQVSLIPLAAPTPARHILHIDIDDDRAAAAVRPRPPTPPRAAARTPANGYPRTPQPKRPRSPQPALEGRLPVPRREGAQPPRPRPLRGEEPDSVMSTAPTTASASVSSVFTPNPTPSAPSASAPASTYIPRHTHPRAPHTAPVKRTLAALPRSREPLRGPIPQPSFALATPRRTVHVSFGVGQSTRKSESRTGQGGAGDGDARGTDQVSTSARVVPNGTLSVDAGDNDLTVAQSNGTAMDIESPTAVAELPRLAEATCSTASSASCPDTPSGIAPPPTPALPTLAPPTPAPPTICITHADDDMDVDDDVPSETQLAISPESAGATTASAQVPTSAVPPAPAPTAPASRTRPPTIPSSLPVRRPSTRPSNAPASASTSVPVASPGDTRRKPSYPSSLGLGPPARPTPRVVSNPFLRTDVDMEAAAPRSPRSISEPTRPMSRVSSLSMSTRREGFEDASANLSGLNDLLARLKVRKASGGERARARSVLGSAARHSEDKENNPAARRRSDPDALTARPTSPPLSITNTSTSSIAALLADDKRGTYFKGVVAFVDVWSADGSNTSSVFEDVLVRGGARVLTRLGTSCTHVVYKDGKPGTCAAFRRLDESRRALPHVVGIKWVMESARARVRQEEGRYAVNLDEEDVFQKRRKSMEPKKLAVTGLSVPTLLPVPENRGMLYAPKISSPLKRSSFTPHRDAQ